MPDLDLILDGIVHEYNRAVTLHRPMPSRENGLCVIAEELGELAQAILRGESDDHLIREAESVGAMAIRFIHDCCGVGDVTPLRRPRPTHADPSQGES